jgi:hypothetical protein
MKKNFFKIFPISHHDYDLNNILTSKDIKSRFLRKNYMFSLFYDFYIDSRGKKSAYFIIFYREVFFIFGKIFFISHKINFYFFNFKQYFKNFKILKK